jgi:hypothetical protein
MIAGCLVILSRRAKFPELNLRHSCGVGSASPSDFYDFVRLHFAYWITPIDQSQGLQVIR